MRIVNRQFGRREGRGFARTGRLCGIDRHLRSDPRTRSGRHTAPQQKKKEWDSHECGDDADRHLSGRHDDTGYDVRQGEKHRSREE